MKEIVKRYVLLFLVAGLFFSCSQMPESSDDYKSKEDEKKIETPESDTPAPVKKEDKFTIEYVSEYGNVPVKKSVTSGTVLDASYLPELTYDGYVFLGWFIEDEKVQADSLTVIKDIKLIAKWSDASKVTITFCDAYATSGSAPEQITVNKGESITIPYNNMQRKEEGKYFEFKGWNESENLNQESYLSGNTYVFEKSVTLYSMWLNVYESSVIIYYHLDGGINNSENSYTVTDFNEPDKDVELKAPSKEGCRFLGWYENENFTGPVISEYNFYHGAYQPYVFYAKFIDINAPLITKQPESGGSPLNQTASLTIETEANDLYQTEYHWYKADSLDGQYSEISGVTTNTLPIDTSAVNKGWYYCIATNTDSEGKTYSSRSDIAKYYVLDEDNVCSIKQMDSVLSSFSDSDVHKITVVDYISDLSYLKSYIETMQETLTAHTTVFVNLDLYEVSGMTTFDLYASSGSIYGCDSLIEITFPYGLKSTCRILDSCKNLKSAHFPSTFNHFEQWCYGHPFSECYSLREITFEGETLEKYIMKDQICYTKDMKEIVFALYDLDYTEFTVPESVSKIDCYAFEFNKKLTKITLHENITIGHACFDQADKLEELTIPYGCIIESSALASLCAKKLIYNCSTTTGFESHINMGVNEIVIGSNVETVIGRGTFACPDPYYGNNPNLYLIVTVVSETPPILKDIYVSEHLSKYLKIYVPANSVAAYKEAWAPVASLIFANEE